MTWNLAFYQTPRGERPAVAFVEQLAEPARADVAARLAALRERGNLLRPPHSKALGDIPAAVLRRIRLLQSEIVASRREGGR